MTSRLGLHDVEAVDPKSTLANNTITTLAKVPRKIYKVKHPDEKLLGSFPKRQGSFCGSQYRGFCDLGCENTDRHVWGRDYTYIQALAQRNPNASANPRGSVCVGLSLQLLPFCRPSWSGHPLASILTVADRTRSVFGSVPNIVPTIPPLTYCSPAPLPMRDGRHKF